VIAQNPATVPSLVVPCFLIYCKEVHGTNVRNVLCNKIYVGVQTAHPALCSVGIRGAFPEAVGA
jgi:hypothetical protein